MKTREIKFRMAKLIGYADGTPIANAMAKSVEDLRREIDVIMEDTFVEVSFVLKDPQP